MQPITQAAGSLLRFCSCSRLMQAVSFYNFSAHTTSAIEAHMYGLCALPIFAKRLARLLVLCGLLGAVPVTAQVPATTVPGYPGALGTGKPSDPFLWLASGASNAPSTNQYAREVQTLKSVPNGSAQYIARSRSYATGLALARGLVPWVRVATTAVAVYSFLNDAGLISQGGQIGVTVNSYGGPVRMTFDGTSYFSSPLEAAKYWYGASNVISVTPTSPLGTINGVPNSQYFDVVRVGNTSGTTVTYKNMQFVFQAPTTPTPLFVPKTDDEIATALSTSSALPSIVRELDPDGVKLPWSPSVMVLPDPISFPSSTTVNPDGTKSIKERTLIPSISPDGQTVDWKEQVKTTTYDQNGNPTGTTTTTQDQKTPDPDFCDSHPDSIGCADLDTPDGDIPKANKNISYQAEQIFGGGSCPSDKFARLGGQQIKVWDWQQACGYIVLARPVLIAAASFMALMIVIGAKVEL